MSQPMTDLFGEPRIRIEGNPLLEGIANHILSLVERNPELLDGDKVGDIDRKITLAIWYSEGLGKFIPKENREAFAEWFNDLKKHPDEEDISRARRWLSERDYLRLPTKAVVTAEQDRQRIARSIKG